MIPRLWPEINYCKEKLYTSNVDVVDRVLNKIDGQLEYSSRPHGYQGYERSQDVYDSFVKSKIAVCDEVKSVNEKQIYLKQQNNHADAYKQDVFESLVNLRENVSVSRSTEGQFKESVGEKTSLDLNEEVCCSVDDDGNSQREHVDEWSNAYVSERNGLKMKISLKRKHKEDANGSDDKTNGTSPLSTPLPKKVNGTSPLNTPFPKKIKRDVI